LTFAVPVAGGGAGLDKIVEEKLSMNKIICVASIAVVGGLAWQSASVKLPAPYATPSTTNRAQVIERPAGAKLTLPAGFSIAEYATDFKRPRYMLLGPSGEVLVTDSVEGGSVYLVGDRNRDFTADSRRELIGGLDRPYGMAFHQGFLYVAETTSVKRYPYDAKAMTVGKGQEIFAMPEFGKGHWTRTIAFDSKGKLYLGIGSASNVDHGEPKQRAAILRMNADGTGQEIYASGTRNPTSIRFYPGTDTLWSAVQERDALGDDLVPDYLTSIKPGGFYGWPYAYIGPNPDPRRTENPSIVKTAIVPDIVLGAHVAVLDFLPYTGKQFPADYQNGIFIAQHGSWNRAERTGYNLMFVPFKDGKPSGAPRQFLGGWMLSPTQREVWGRPVGLLQMPDGSILVSDDGGNKIWRISYRG
jgi:glucose/arabinose dehydrogenase